MVDFGAPSMSSPANTIDREFVDRARANPTETRQLEFKEARNNFKREKAREYCVAIANEGGGHLILGVADGLVDGARPVVGTNAFLNPTDLEHYLLGACKFHVSVHEVNHPDGRVLVLSIPSRPRGVALEVEGRYVMRSGESIVSMPPDRLKQIFTEDAPHWGDEPIREGVSAQDVVALLDTQQFFDLLGQKYPTTQAGVLDRLQQRRIVTPRGAGYDISRLGALLLAKKLESFHEIERRAPRVIVYEGTTKLETKLDLSGGLGYAVGFQGLVKYIMSHMRRHEIVRDALREEVTLVPEIMIRELVANALVHQDLSISGVSPMIEIYDDRIEISNPGNPVVDTDRFIDGCESRNELMAKLMRSFRVCEEKGSGIDKVINAAEEASLLAPDIRVGPNRTSVIVFGPRDFVDMTAEERIRACFQHCALKYVSNDYMTNQSLRARFRLPDDKAANVSHVINATMDAGLVKLDESVGASKKNARYVPVWA